MPKLKYIAIQIVSMWLVALVVSVIFPACYQYKGIGVLAPMAWLFSPLFVWVMLLELPLMWAVALPILLGLGLGCFAAYLALRGRVWRWWWMLPLCVSSGFSMCFFCGSMSA